MSRRHGEHGALRRKDTKNTEHSRTFNSKSASVFPASPWQHSPFLRGELLRGSGAMSVIVEELARREHGPREILELRSAGGGVGRRVSEASEDRVALGRGRRPAECRHVKRLHGGWVRRAR